MKAKENNEMYKVMGQAMFKQIADQMNLLTANMIPFLDQAKAGIKHMWTKQENDHTLETIEGNLKVYGELRDKILHDAQWKNGGKELLENVMPREQWISSLDNLIVLLKQIKRELED